MVAVVLCVSFFVWYITYTSRVQIISELSARVRKFLISTTGTSIDQIFRTAEKDLDFVLATLESKMMLERLCTNWTEPLITHLHARSASPVFPQLSFLSIKRAIPINGIFTVVDGLLAFYWHSHFARGSQQGDSIYLEPCEINDLNHCHSANTRVDIRILIVGSIDGDSRVHPINASLFPRIRRDPVWEKETYFQLPRNIATFSVYGNLRCPAALCFISVVGGIDTSKFSKLLAESVEGMQRMFLTLQRADGRLVGTSHGKNWSHSDLAPFSQELLHAAPLKWYIPQNCTDEVCFFVASSMCMYDGT